MTRRRSVLIALLVFCGLQIAIGIMYVTMLETDHDNALQRLSNDVEQVAHAIDNDLKNRFLALERMASRWEVEQGTPKEQFDADAGHYVTDMPGFQAIEWVDESMHVRWIVPLEGNEAAQDLFLGASAPRRTALVESARSNTIILSDPISLVQGGHGFLGFIPLKATSNTGGHILAVFRFNEWINHLVASINGRSAREDLRNMRLVLTMNGQEVFNNGYKEVMEDKHTAKISDFTFGESEFVLTGSMEHAYLDEIRSFQPEIYAFIATFVSLLAAMLAYSLMQSREAYALARRNLHEVREKEKALAQAVKTANAANAAKSNFLATMSHEIRTPMNGILGTAQILAQSDLPHDQEQHVTTILSSGESLLVILNDILDMSKIEAGALSLDYHDFHLGNLVSTVCAPFVNVATDRGIDLKTEFHTPEHQILHGDSTRLRQILWNLLSNALKFTRKGHITLRVSSLERDGHQIIFEIEDTGSGINAQKRKAIFEPFAQEDNTITRKHGGTGLGLSIVRKLVELMKGSIELESEVGKGSLFRITMPLKQAASSELAETPEKRVEQTQSTDTRLKILLVEDNPVNAMIGTTFLKKMGYRFVHAEDGEKAITAFENFQPDLILMDIHMPNMNGIMATKAIRQLQNGKQIPIIAQTADAMDEHKKEFMAAGMNDVIIKPFTYEQLAATIMQNHIPA